MSQNEALLGELRKYLGSAQYNPQVRESEQVLALKHDLNLAARVGQQLLMQLQAAEKQNKANEIQLEQLKASNARLAQENQRLAAEHELLAETLESQDAEIASLVQRLQDAMGRSAKLARASQSARSLEKEVQLLEQMQADLRTELEANVQRRDAAERLARSLAQHVATTYKDLRADVGLPLDAALDAPSDVSQDLSLITLHSATQITRTLADTPDDTPADPPVHAPSDTPVHVDASVHAPVHAPVHTSADARADTSAAVAPRITVPQPDDASTVRETPPHVEAAGARRAPQIRAGLAPVQGACNGAQDGLLDVPELTNDSTTEPNMSTGVSADTSASVSVDSFGVHPVDTATPLRAFRPKLARAHSHESVLSLAPAPPLFKTLAPSRQLDATLAPKAVTALSGQHSFTASSSSTPRPAGTSARDRLSQMAPDRKPRAAAESRWHFTPFRR